MKILVTGSKGFIGRNLVENLKNIRDKKNLTHQNLTITDIYEYNRQCSDDDLDRFCSDCDFVFNLAGVNRPKDLRDFREGNVIFSSRLLNALKVHGNQCPVMLASSIQASLEGCFKASEYGRSKLEAEELFFNYSKENGAKVLVYRFPNVIGKWIRPNYNSAVGTFCFNIANDLPVTVNNKDSELNLLFIDDLVEEMLDALEGNEHHCEYSDSGPILKENGKYCIPIHTYKATLERIVSLLYMFHNQPDTLIMPSIPEGSFEKKLYSVYLSYLPASKVKFRLDMHNDYRGSFTELMKTADHGQFSVNIIRPGITKGEHWHNSKWEFFIVVSGHGLIQERKIGTDEILEFEVNGDIIEAVHMLPGYTHNIKNLSETDNLVTLMWANEIFSPDNPDTFSEKV